MIRKATQADTAVLLEMFEEFYASDAVYENIPQSFHHKTLEELFSPHSRQIAYVFTDRKQVVGYALLSDKFSHEAGGMEWWLEEIYLREPHRGNGMGKEFFRFLTDLADQKGICRLRLEVEPDNHRAAKLYESFGFTPLPYAQMTRKGDIL